MNQGIVERVVDDEPSWAMLHRLMEHGSLSGDRREAAVWALHCLEDVLGASWPRRQFQRAGFIPDELLRFASYTYVLPLLLGFVTRLMATIDEPTFAPVLSGLRRGLDLSGWRHLQLQLEVARALGRPESVVTFEPNISGSDRKADLRVQQPGREWLVETTALFRSMSDRQATMYEDMFRMALRAIEVRHHVHCLAYLEDHLDKPATDRWLADVESACQNILKKIGKAAIGDRLSLVRDAVAEVAQTLADEDLEIVRQWFTAHGIPAEFRTIPSGDPATSILNRNQVLVAVPAERWANAIEVLHQWPVDQRRGLSGGLLAVPVVEQALIPSALRLLGGATSPWPVTDLGVLRTASAALALPMPEATSLTQVVTRTIRGLTEASTEKVRDSHRDPTWAKPPHISRPPRELADHLRDEFASATGSQDINRLAVNSLATLCSLVEAEDGNSGGFAATLASHDPANPRASSRNPYLAQVGVLTALGVLMPSDPATDASNE